MEQTGGIHTEFSADLKVCCDVQVSYELVFFLHQKNNIPVEVSNTSEKYQH